jgi:threonine/homoserine efflux transporter RhtA
MTPQRDPALARYYLIVLARIVPVAGALFGLVLLGRAVGYGDRILGVAIVIAALAVMATLPRALARRWRSPREEG